MIELKAQKREILGRKVKYLRKEGLIPCELYGHGSDNVHLSIPVDTFDIVYKEAGENAIVNVTVDGNSVPALIYSVHRHPITREILSVDLYHVKMDEKVTTHVPINFEGDSPAVSDLAGVLVKTMKEIEVEALPADIPSEITVDLGLLTELDTSIYVKDLPKSDVYVFLLDEDNAVASVSAPREEEEEPTEEIAPEDVIVEGEEKRAEGEGEGTDESTADEKKEENSSSEA